MDVPYRVVVADAVGPVARTLRDAGLEVVCTGPASAAQLAEVCLQEDADAVGPPVAGLADELRRRGLDDVVLFDDPRELVELLQRGAEPGEAGDPGPPGDSGAAPG